VLLREVNWLAAPAPRRCGVKLRARDAVQGAVVAPTPDGAEVLLDTPALAAPGQACVFYDGERVLGGGFIVRRD
jgi:tRNA-specific 2-thiouridylase